MCFRWSVEALNFENPTGHCTRRRSRVYSQLGSESKTEIRDQLDVWCCRCAGRNATPRLQTSALISAPAADFLQKISFPIEEFDVGWSPHDGFARRYFLLLAAAGL